MLKYVFLVISAISLTACSGGGINSLLPKKSIEYENETQAERSLEVPPDLTSEGISTRIGVGGTNYSEFIAKTGAAKGAGYSGKVLPEIAGVRVLRDTENDLRWLQVNASADVVWTQVLDFWNEEGVLIAEQDALTGVMMTGWLENRAVIGNDIITRTLRKVVDDLYETGERDAYRVRLERSSSQVTDVYLTHFGMTEQFGEQGTVESDRIVWTRKPRDPGLEAEMLRRMMVYMGVTDAKARAELAAQGVAGRRSQLLKGPDGVQLVIAQPFDRAWRLTGLALDRVGFAVEDRDRAKGIYYVRYDDPTADGPPDEGFLASLKFWKKDKKFDVENTYQVRVADGINSSVVTVHDAQGPAADGTAARILDLLHKEIR